MAPERSNKALWITLSAATVVSVVSAILLLLTTELETSPKEVPDEAPVTSDVEIAESVQTVDTGVKRTEYARKISHRVPVKKPASPMVSPSEDPAQTKSWITKNLTACKRHIAGKRFSRARACLKMMLAVDSENADANLMLGIVHASQGKRDEAYWNYLKYLQLAPDGKHAAKVDGALRAYEEYQANGGESTVTNFTRQEREEVPRYQAAIEDPRVSRVARDLLSATGPELADCLARDAAFDYSVDDLAVVIEVRQDGFLAEIFTLPGMSDQQHACYKSVLEEIRFPSFHGDFSERRRHYTVHHDFGTNPDHVAAP